MIESMATVPLDYRYALDAARTLLGAEASVVCSVPELEPAVRQRFSGQDLDRRADRVLWIEPRESDWDIQLIRLAAILPVASQLVIIISRPLSRMIPERQSWDRDAVGLRIRETRSMLRCLSDAGFACDETFGVHTLDAIAINLASRVAGAIGRPDWEDRLHFAARLRYCRDGRLSTVATVGLLRMRRVRR